jgi:hypothetical protein
MKSWILKEFTCQSHAPPKNVHLTGNNTSLKTLRSMPLSDKKKLLLEQAHLSPERLTTAKIEECIKNLRRRRQYLI